MIEWILQVDGQNMLQVHYDSGTDRYVMLDDWGNYKLTKTQKAYMDNAEKYEMLNADGWGRKFYYWLDKDNPYEPVLSQIKIRRELYGKEEI